MHSIFLRTNSFISFVSWHFIFVIAFLMERASLLVIRLIQWVNCKKWRKRIVFLCQRMNLIWVLDHQTLTRLHVPFDCYTWWTQVVMTFYVQHWWYKGTTKTFKSICSAINYEWGNGEFLSKNCFMCLAEIW